MLLLYSHHFTDHGEISLKKTITMVFYPPKVYIERRQTPTLTQFWNCGIPIPNCCQIQTSTNFIIAQRRGEPIRNIVVTGRAAGRKPTNRPLRKLNTVSAFTVWAIMSVACGVPANHASDHSHVYWLCVLIAEILHYDTAEFVNLCCRSQIPQTDVRTMLLAV